MIRTPREKMPKMRPYLPPEKKSMTFANRSASSTPPRIASMKEYQSSYCSSRRICRQDRPYPRAFHCRVGKILEATAEPVVKLRQDGSKSLRLLTSSGSTLPGCSGSLVRVTISCKTSRLKKKEKSQKMMRGKSSSSLITTRHGSFQSTRSDY